MRGTQIMMLGLAVLLLSVCVVTQTATEDSEGVNDLGTFTWYPNLSDENNAYSAINMHVSDYDEIPSFEHIYVMMGASVVINVDEKRPNDYPWMDDPWVQHIELVGDDMGLSVSSDRLTASGIIDSYGECRVEVHMTSPDDPDTDVFHSIQIVCFKPPQYVTSIDWSGDTSYMVGETIHISAIGMPATADDRAIEFTVIDGQECIHKAGFTIVGAPFEAEAIAAGQVVLQGQAVDDGGYTDTITITISENPNTTTFYLIFNDNGGSGGPGQLTYGPTLDTSHEFTIPNTIPTWDDRDFLGWSHSAGGGGELLQPGETINLGDSGTPETTFTLYASWSDGGYLYKLSFDANGGTGGPDPLEYGPTQDQWHNWTIPDEVPTWTGHQFAGWAESESVSDPELYRQPGDSYTTERNNLDAVLYAQWLDAPITTYIVNFNANGGTGAPATINSGPVSVIQYQVTVPMQEPTRSGYRFLGWNSDQDADFARWQPGDSFYILPTGEATVSMTLYAIWANSYTYTLSFDARGGSGAPSPLTYGPTSDTSHQFIIPQTTPTSSDPDVEFGGWSMYPDGSGNRWQPGDTYTIQASDSSAVTDTLYAIWDRTAWEFTLSFIAPGASNVPGQMSSGKVATPYYTFTIPQTMPTREGWEFTGWDASGGASGTYQPGEQIRVTDVTVLYAQWESTGYEYVLSFDVNGGMGQVPNPLNPPPTTAESYTFTIPQSHPLWDNHTFEGWALSPDGAAQFQPGGTITLYAPNVTQKLYAVWSSTGSTVIEITGPSSVMVGETIRLTATVTPELSEGVTWAVVSGLALIDDQTDTTTTWTAEAVAAGNLVIRATAADDPQSSTDWTVMIVADSIIPTSIDITGPGTVTVGSSGEINAAVLPTNALNRGVLWSVSSGESLMDYDTDSTFRGGVMTFKALAVGTVTIVATSTADSSVTATYTLTIIAQGAGEDANTLDINNVVQLLADAVFVGNTVIAGLVIFALIILAVFLLFREPLPVLIAAIPVSLILRLLRVLDTDLAVLLIIISVLGLALVARNIWRD